MNSVENAKILVADDDPEIVNAVSKLLTMEGYSVLSAHDGLQALTLAASEPIDLILMDLMMPRVDGISAVMKIRATKNIPIIIISAKAEDGDKILGLNVGADDYIVKPFHAQELLARVRSQLRRYFRLGASPEPDSKSVLVAGSIRMDTATKEVSVDGRAANLTATEWKILELLVRSPGKVYSAESIYRTVWGETSPSAENTVMVHIRRIREKIEEDPKNPRSLKVVWGVGYKVEK